MDRWALGSRLAVGGQAEIWEAQEVPSGEVVALKKLLETPQLKDPAAELRRFKREVRCQSSMNHPGIVPILGFDFEIKTPYYVMPKATKTLHDVIDQNAPGGIDPEESSAIILEVSKAVEYAHEQGVLHRDLKPTNILEIDGRWKVGDFGMCRDINMDSTVFTKPNTIVGTVAYMAPEQFDDGHSVTAAADVFSLGRVFYHMLTGRPPFPYMPLPQLPPEFRHLISKATADEPLARYQTVAEFARDIMAATDLADNLTAPLERASKELVRVLAGEHGAAAALAQRVVANIDDEVFYAQFVATLPRVALNSLMEADPVSFRQMVNKFDECSQGYHPFDHVNVIVDFFANVFALSDDVAIRSLALRRILIIGPAHNRWHAGTVLARLIADISETADVAMAINVMRSDLHSAKWFVSYLRRHSFNDAIERFVEEELM